MFSVIKQLIQGLDTSIITAERKAILQPLRSYVQGKKERGENIALQFICTHNSRRSHLGQVWAQTMATYFAVPHVYAFSGGTEATAVFSQTLKTLEDQGFEIIALSDGQNPVHAITFAEASMPIIAFSKTFDHAFNPSSRFAAIMTCDSADEACPYVPGADARFAVKYSDPKISDQTPAMAQTYHERSLEIAREMKFVFE